MDDSNRYILHGGQKGYDRLQLLSRERWPSTAAMFRRAGLAPGMRCVDLGCGGGEVTFEIARWVAPDGSAVGIDLDPVKLDLATAAARDRGVSNVAFRRLLVQEWNEPGAYDAAFSRFLLQHLTDPNAVLRRMWASLRPGGLLLVEDVDWEGWSSDPRNPGVDFLRDKYIELLVRRGGNPWIGRELYRRCLELGIPEPDVALVAPLHARGEGRRLPILTMEAMADAMRAEGVATSDEIASAKGSLQGLLDDPRSIVTSPRIFQVVARKATPSPPQERPP